MLASQKKVVHAAYVLEVFGFLVALALFLVIIVSILNRINDNLGAVDRQASAVDRSATSLPGLVSSITGSLVAIEKDVNPITGQLDQINGGLADAQNGLTKADSDLKGTNGDLAHIEVQLIASLGFAHRVRDGSFAVINQLTPASNEATQAAGLVNAINADAGNIETLATRINGHLASIAGEAAHLP